MIGGYYLLLAPGNLYNALVSEDWGLFASVMTRFAGIATVVLLIKVLRGFFREAGANLLRSRLTHRLHGLYLGAAEIERGYYAPPYYNVLNDYQIDNPDQRIVADAREFCNGLFDIVAGGGSQGSDSGGVIEAVASVLFYTVQTYVRTGWFGLIAAYAWSTGVAFVTIFVINRTSPVLFTQERLEGDLRYAHAQLRRHAEEIAFLRGAPFERRCVDTHLSAAVSNQWTVISRHAWLNGLQYGFGYYISLVMYVTLAAAMGARVFEGGAGFPSAGTAGEKARWISQTGSVFLQLLYSFTMLVQLATSVSSFVANVGRLDALVSSLRRAGGRLDRQQGVGLEADPSVGFGDNTQPLMAVSTSPENDTDTDTHTDPTVAAEGLEVSRAGGPRVGPVTFSLRRGGSVLLHGAVGSGKTTLLRALRGLWRATSGTAHLPQDVIIATANNRRAPFSQLVFAPQRPYVPTGARSLRELVVYPLACDGGALEEVRVTKALRAVGWRGGVDERALDVGREDWHARLSPGEAQLIAAARILFAQPHFALLDEPTAALDAAAERRVLSAMRDAGVATFIVGHSPSLQTLHHDAVISLDHEPLQSQRES